jgi:hypothetical protein
VTAAAAAPIVSLASGRRLASNDQNLFPANLYPTTGVHHAVRLKKSKIGSSIDSVSKQTTTQSASLAKDKVYVYPPLI